MLSSSVKCHSCGVQVSSWLFCLRCPRLEVCFLCYATSNDTVIPNHCYETHAMQCYPQGSQALNGLGQSTVFTLTCPLCSTIFSSLESYRMHIVRSHDNPADRLAFITCPICALHCADVVAHSTDESCDESKLNSEDHLNGLTSAASSDQPNDLNEVGGTTTTTTITTALQTGKLSTMKDESKIVETSSQLDDASKLQITPYEDKGFSFIPLLIPTVSNESPKMPTFMHFSKFSVPISRQLWENILPLWRVLHCQLKPRLGSTKMINQTNRICHILESLLSRIACSDRRSLSAHDVDEILAEAKKLYPDQAKITWPELKSVDPGICEVIKHKGSGKGNMMSQQPAVQAVITTPESGKPSAMSPQHIKRVFEDISKVLL